MTNDNQSICIAAWRPSLGRIVHSILKKYSMNDIIALDMNVSSHNSVILKAKAFEKSDIIVTEAYNNRYVLDGEGFRLAKDMATHKKKPLIIFRSLQPSFRESPHLIDYYSIHLLPLKIEQLQTLGKSIMDHILEIEKAYPHLCNKPIH